LREFDGLEKVVSVTIMAIHVGVVTSLGGNITGIFSAKMIYIYI
jgi:hypothetical protein